MEALKILIVEDEFIIARNLQVILEDLGYEPLEPVGTKKAAIAAIDELEIDLVILDIKHINPNKYKELTDVNLENTLEFAKYLNEIGKKTWVRYVLVPGYSDDEEDLNKWAKFVSQFSNVERVDILPFHQMGGYKWEEVGKEYKLKETPTPTKESLQKTEEIFSSYGLNIGI